MNHYWVVTIINWFNTSNTLTLKYLYTISIQFDIGETIPFVVGIKYRKWIVKERDKESKPCGFVKTLFWPTSAYID